MFMQHLALICTSLYSYNSLYFNASVGRMKEFGFIVLVSVFIYKMVLFDPPCLIICCFLFLHVKVKNDHTLPVCTASFSVIILLVVQPQVLQNNFCAPGVIENKNLFLEMFSVLKIYLFGL